MGKEKANSCIYYFEHDKNSRNDTRMLLLESAIGKDVGYARYFKTLELMADQRDGKLYPEHSDIYAMSLRLTMDEFDTLVGACVRIGLFCVDEGGCAYSPRFVEWLDEINAKRTRSIDMNKSRWKNMPEEGANPDAPPKKNDEVQQEQHLNGLPAKDKRTVEEEVPSSEETCATTVVEEEETWHPGQDEKEGVGDQVVIADAVPRDEAASEGAGDTGGVKTSHKKRKGSNDTGDSVMTIINVWNECATKDKKVERITKPLIDVIGTKLSKYSMEKISDVIRIYWRVIKNEDAFFSWKWSLSDFLKKGNAFAKFAEDGAEAQYLAQKKNNKANPHSLGEPTGEW